MLAVHMALRATALFLLGGMGLVASSVSCDEGRAKTDAVAQAVSSGVPPEVAVGIKRLTDVTFVLDRDLLSLSGAACRRLDRAEINKSLTGRLYGLSVKWSPEARDNHWIGMRIYLDLDARVAGRRTAADHVLQVLGVDPATVGGTSISSKAELAIRRSLEQSSHSDAGFKELRARIDVIERSIDELRAAENWKASADGSLPTLLGFEDLDLIQQVNGVDIHDLVGGCDVLAELDTEDQIDVRLLRDDRPLLLTYQLRSTE